MSTFSAQSSITIQAPIEEVFDKVVYFEEMNKWSPWLIMDSEANVERLGEDGTLGATHIWDGPMIGYGELKNTHIEPLKSIIGEVNFSRPMNARSKINFKFSARAQYDFSELDEQHTQVSWTMQGQLPWTLALAKSTIERSVKADYKRGLTMLKEYCEQGEITSKVEVLGTKVGQAFDYIGLKENTSLDQLPQRQTENFTQLYTYLQERHLPDSQIAFTMYHRYDTNKDRCQYTAGLSLNQLPDITPEPFISGTIAAGSALVVKHTGAYTNLPNAWETGQLYLKHHGLKFNAKSSPLEIYVSDPRNTPVKDLVTMIYFPVK